MPRIDAVDKASVPYFVGSMLLESAVLRQGPVRDPRELDALPRSAWTGGGPDPDPLVPVGYERRDTVASLSVLLGSVVINLATMPLLDRMNRWLYDRRFIDLSKRNKVAVFAAAMVLWDLLYYWDHRLQHEVRLLWANHVAHHSSERYNLSTALRQPWTSLMLAWAFAPMPLLGFHPHTVMRAGQINLLYQFWIHTEAIDRLPPAAEQVLNTPSHHRVHHGTNPQYLDKNYGGVLIVWDKLFGTFEPEVRRLRYGLTKNIGTFNPVRIGFGEYVAIARDVKAAKGWRNKLSHVLRGPGWSYEHRPGVPAMAGTPGGSARQSSSSKRSRSST